MANTALYASAAVSLLIVTLLFLIAALQNALRRRRCIATPTISKKDAVFTVFASTRIKATADEVFDVVMNFKNYSAWSPLDEYKWSTMSADGVPLDGSTGTFKVKSPLDLVRMKGLLYCVFFVCRII